MPAPSIIKPIPEIRIKEKTILDPIDFKEYIEVSPESSSTFKINLENGDSLPVGLMCTREGILSGYPGQGTEGSYNLVLTVENEEGAVESRVALTIDPREVEEELEGYTPVSFDLESKPTLIQPIPNQITNEHAAFGPFSLKEYFEGGKNLQFQAELENGNPLPQGMICTGDGMLTGIAAEGTSGTYQIKVKASNNLGKTQTTLMLTIKPAPTATTDYLGKLKAQVWDALEHRLPPPDIRELYEQNITEAEIAHLIDRWGFMSIWDAFNLEAPGKKIPLELPDASPHYDVYDRGSCIVASPKDLFSHERTMEDSLQTARAIAREVYRRQWTVELTGIAKMTRAAWIEIQHLNDEYGQSLEIINYEPQVHDINLYASEALTRRRGSGQSYE